MTKQQFMLQGGKLEDVYVKDIASHYSISASYPGLCYTQATNKKCIINRFMSHKLDPPTVNAILSMIHKITICSN